MTRIIGSTRQVSIVAPPETALAQAAFGLDPEDWVDFTPNTTQNANDIQWMLSPIFYDTTRKEIQYVGKPASGQSTDYTHFVYSEAQDQWTKVGVPFSGQGHTWCYAFDPATGDYYASPENTSVVRRFRRALGVSLDSWMQCANAQTQTGQSLNNGLNAPIYGFHPNLFGEGNGGLYVHNAFRPFAYDPAEDQWHLLKGSSWTSGTPPRNRSNGQALYLPGPDRLAIFSQDDGGGASGGTHVLWIEAGAGLSSDIVADELISWGANEPPILISGKGGGANHGHVVNHPDDPDVLLILEENGDERVWISTDYGSSWTLMSGVTHPFITGSPPNMSATNAGEFATGTIGGLGVIIGMTSSGTGGTTRLWKPPALAA